jgi:CRP/FNR family transcriptional regulator, cyclic AMP receptor protein
MSLPQMALLPELHSVLTSVFFLRSQSTEVRAELARLASCRDYPRGNLLYYRGDPSDAVYIMVSGRVKIALANEDGREVVLSVIRPGSVFGLVEALDQGPHTGTATTLTDCRLARIPVDRFLAWLRGRPVVHQTLVIELAQMLRDAYEKVGEQALLSVKRRLHAALLEIARSEGKHQGDQVVFMLPTHQELAERVGSSRVVVSRTLKELLEEEDLSAAGRVIRVPLSALVMREEF